MIEKSMDEFLSHKLIFFSSISVWHTHTHTHDVHSYNQFVIFHWPIEWITLFAFIVSNITCRSLHAYTNICNEWQGHCDGALFCFAFLYLFDTIEIGKLKCSSSRMSYYYWMVIDRILYSVKSKSTTYYIILDTSKCSLLF